MKKKKVIIGLSGGVDSAVAVIRLLEQGYEVEGIFMRNWDSSINNDILGNPHLQDPVCPQETDYMDALEVAEQLGIKLRRVDFVQEYWKRCFLILLMNIVIIELPILTFCVIKKLSLKAF